MLNSTGVQGTLVQKYYFPENLIMLIINSREEIPLEPLPLKPRGSTKTVTP
jgi:hypothetical protein